MQSQVAKDTIFDAMAEALTAGTSIQMAQLMLETGLLPRTVAFSSLSITCMLLSGEDFASCSRGIELPSNDFVQPGILTMVQPNEDMYSSFSCFVNIVSHYLVHAAAVCKQWLCLEFSMLICHAKQKEQFTSLLLC